MCMIRKTCLRIIDSEAAPKLSHVRIRLLDIEYFRYSILSNIVFDKAFITCRGFVPMSNICDGGSGYSTIDGSISGVLFLHS